MKKLLFLISIVAISCQSPYGSVTTTDQKSKIVEELFKNVSDENIDYLKEVFSDEMEFVDSKGNTLNKEGFIAGVENIFDQHYRTFASWISAPGRSLILGTRVNF